MLDSGSIGLRVYAQDAPSELPLIKNGNNQTLAQCTTFFGASAWGPQSTADIYIGGNVAKNVPLQIIDAKFGSAPKDCTNLMMKPGSDGLAHGILGIASDIFIQNQLLTPFTFYSCQDSSSSSTSVCNKCGTGLNFNWSSCGPGFPTMPSNWNSISYMSEDSNGWMLQIPEAPPLDGSPKLIGTFTLGVGTRPNNMPPKDINSFPLKNSMSIPVQFQGKNYFAILDTGGVTWSFPTSLIDNTGAPVPLCSEDPSYYCPQASLSTHAIVGAAGGSQADVQITIVNPKMLSGSAQGLNVIFNDIGKIGPVLPNGLTYFNMGAPFFMGRTVYQVFYGESVPALGIGPLVAF